MRKYNTCKAIAFVLSFAIALSMFVMVPKQKIYAAGISISASSTNVNVGDTVKVTVSVPSGYFAQIRVSVSGSAFSDTSDRMVVIGDLGINQLSDTITYTATSEGSCTVTATPVDVSDINETDPGFSATSVTINVANQTSTPTTPENPPAGGTDTPAQTQSADNTLQSLTISPGTLSPAFSKNTTNYTAIVDNSVTKITVSAKPNDANAKVSSVSGNDNLAVGENTISIKVKAENGVSKTYKIVVTRKDENGEIPKVNVPEPATFKLGDKTLFVSEVIADSLIPTDFAKDNITLNGTEYPCLVHTNGTLTLVFLMEENSTEGQLYLLNREENSVSPFLRLLSENGYLILLDAPADLVLSEYEECALSIEGKGLVSAYKADKDPEDFYLVYGMNQQMKTGWYWYDLSDGTYLKYEEIDEIVLPEPDTTALDELQAKYDALDKEFAKWKEMAKWALYIAGAVFVILLFVIIMLIIFRRKPRNPKGPKEAIPVVDVEETEVEAEAEEVETEEVETEETEAEAEAAAAEEEEEEELPNIEAALLAEMAKMEAEIVDEKEEETPVHKENIHEIEATTLEEFLDERKEAVEAEEAEAAEEMEASSVEDEDDNGLEFIDL